MVIESTKVEVNADQNTVVSFLKDSQNLINLLPKDQISDWKSTSTECSFKVQGGVIISLIQDGVEADSKVFMKSGEKSPFPFRLTMHVAKKGDHSEGYVEFDGEVNVFLKMMVQKPLTALFNMMSENLKKYFEK